VLTPCPWISTTCMITAGCGHNLAVIMHVG